MKLGFVGLIAAPPGIDMLPVFVIEFLHKVLSSLPTAGPIRRYFFRYLIVQPSLRRSTDEIIKVETVPFGNCVR